MLSSIAGGALLIAGIAGIAFLRLRHFGLLASVLLGPLPGMAAIGFAAPLWMNAYTGSAGLAYLLGLSVGLVLADDFALRFCEGTGTKPATHAALLGLGPVLGGFVAALTAAMAALGTIGDAAPFPFIVAAWTAASALSAVAVFYLARFLPYSENFVTRRNRMQERWDRIFNRLIAVARPRWGFSVAGIALVFAVLGFFGVQNLTIPVEASARSVGVLSAMVFALVAAVSAAVRDWRVLIASALVLCLPLLIGLWGFARLLLPLDQMNLQLLALAAGIGAVPLVAAGAEMGRAGRSGDDATIAAARILLRSGPGFIFAAAIPALVLLVTAPVAGRAGFALAAAIAFAGAGPPLFLPAFAIVIETWWPRPSTVAARYRLS